MISISAARVTALGTTTNNPFVGFDNWAATATITTTAVLADGAAVNALDGFTFDYWLPNVTTTSAFFRVTFAAPRSVPLVAIAAHNLFSLAATATLQKSTDGGATWSASGMAALITPADNSPICFRNVTSGNDAADWRVIFNGLTAGAPLYIGVIYFGDELVMPARIYQDFSPAISPTEVALQSNVSVGGNLLGASTITKGSTLKASFAHIAESFVRGAMLPFIAAFNAGTGFFFAWRPAKYPQDLHYCWRSGDVLRPNNSPFKDLMSFDLSMQAHEA